MRIGISGLYRSNGGSLTNLVQLLHEWHDTGELSRHEIVIFASPWTALGLERALRAEVIAAVRIVVSGMHDQGLLSRLWFEQYVLVRQLAAHGVDVLFCPANIVPFATRVPTVVTFQNAAPFCESITPRTVGRGLWLTFKLLGVLIGFSARRATRIIFISGYFRELCRKRFGVPPEKCVVIYRACEPGRLSHEERDAVLRRHGIGGRYYLTVSHIWPYKNVIELIQGFALSLEHRAGQPIQLVIAGRVFTPDYERRIHQALAALGDVAPSIRLLGDISHDQVAALLKHAEAFVFSSTCENCPTAVMEALAAELPVACSNVGVMPEIGGDAAIYFDPCSPRDIAASLGRLMDDAALRADLRRRAAERVKAFPNRRQVAEATLRTIVEAGSA